MAGIYLAILILGRRKTLLCQRGLLDRCHAISEERTRVQAMPRLREETHRALSVSFLSSRIIVLMLLPAKILANHVNVHDRDQVFECNQLIYVYAERVYVRVG
jgi:hypothetical protein